MHAEIIKSSYNNCIRIIRKPPKISLTQIRILETDRPFSTPVRSISLLPIPKFIQEFPQLHRLGIRLQEKCNIARAHGWANLSTITSLTHNKNQSCTHIHISNEEHLQHQALDQRCKSHRRYTKAFAANANILDTEHSPRNGSLLADVSSDDVSSLRADNKWHITRRKRHAWFCDSFSAPFRGRHAEHRWTSAYRLLLFSRR